MFVNFSLTIDTTPIIVFIAFYIAKVLVTYLLCNSPKLSDIKAKYICRMMSKR